MTEFKGTRGNWSADGYGKYKSCINVIFGDTGIKTIATIHTNAATEEVKANALLISKAPEMLDMLKMWCIDMEDRGRAYGDCYEMTKQLIKEATEL